MLRISIAETVGAVILTSVLTFHISPVITNVVLAIDHTVILFHFVALHVSHRAIRRSGYTSFLSYLTFHLVQFLTILMLFLVANIFVLGRVLWEAGEDR